MVLLLVQMALALMQVASGARSPNAGAASDAAGSGGGTHDSVSEPSPARVVVVKRYRKRQRVAEYTPTEPGEVEPDVISEARFAKINIFESHLPTHTNQRRR